MRIIIFESEKHHISKITGGYKVPSYILSELFSECFYLAYGIEIPINKRLLLDMTSSQRKPQIKSPSICRGVYSDPLLWNTVHALADDRFLKMAMEDMEPKSIDINYRENIIIFSFKDDVDE